MAVPSRVTRLPEQREDRRARLVRLRQRRDAALRQDVVPRQVRRLFRDVGVADPALGRLVVDDLRLRQADGELQTVLRAMPTVVCALPSVVDRRRRPAPSAACAVGASCRPSGRRRGRAPVDVGRADRAADRCRRRRRLLTNTEKPAAASRPATVASRSISVEDVLELGPSSVAVDVVLVEADCVASVERRSSRVEMLFSAPSLICSVDRPSLALRMPWFRTATSER